MKKQLLLLLGIALLTLQSCATILAPRSNVDLPFDANIEGVEVYVNGAFIGEDPSTVNVSSKDVITFKKDGFKQQSIIIKGKFNAVSLVNLLDPTIIIGWIVDAATGNITKVKTKSLNAYLKESKK